jgi:hypothetical protein
MVEAFLHLIIEASRFLAELSLISMFVVVVLTMDHYMLITATFVAIAAWMKSFLCDNWIAVF